MRKSVFNYFVPRFLNIDISDQRSKIYIYIFISQDETNHRNNIADYNYFTFEILYIYIYMNIGEIERINRPFNIFSSIAVTN